MLERTTSEVTKVDGDVRFEDVTFRYPSRAKATVLSSLNLHLKKGTKNALVGASGSGKSTVIQLILKFYAPTHGTVKIDGVDIASLNGDALRKHIGLVCQEPVLFGTSILENIRYNMYARIYVYVCVCENMLGGM